MSMQAPPTLSCLAMQSLLRNEALTLSALEYLPKKFFPLLFKEAFNSRKSNILRAMVQAWPNPCFALQDFTNAPDLETLQAVLDGVGALIAQKDRPRRCQLQVLDLGDIHHTFWNNWPGTGRRSGSPQLMTETQTVEDQAVSGAKKQPLKVLVDLCFKPPTLDKYQECFFRWAEQRKCFIQLCCQKVQILEKPVGSALRLLEILDPDYMQELDATTLWSVRSPALPWFSPNVVLPRNLEELNNGVTFIDCMYTHLEQLVLSTVISHLPKFTSLRHLCMKEVHFFTVSLDQVLSSVRSSLDTLGITQCLLSQSDLNSLSRYRSIYQLKHLDLSAAKLSHLCAKPLKILLERVSATLQTLELENCRMEDCQIKSLLPALSQCSQLTKVNFYGNSISTSVLKDLLHHTATLSQLSVEQYPAPCECYDAAGGFLVERFTQLGPELMSMLKAIRRSKAVSFASNICLKCPKRCVYSQSMCLCSCWEQQGEGDF